MAERQPCRLVRCEWLYQFAPTLATSSDPISKALLHHFGGRFGRRGRSAAVQELDERRLDSAYGFTQPRHITGHGIKPEHIRRLAPVADGFIVGSAIVRRVEENLTQPRDVLRSKIRSYIREMIAAAKEPVGSAG